MLEPPYQILDLPLDIWFQEASRTGWEVTVQTREIETSSQLHISNTASRLQRKPLETPRMDLSSARTISKNAHSSTEGLDAAARAISIWLSSWKTTQLLLNHRLTPPSPRPHPALALTLPTITITITTTTTATIAH
ncbi:hypothetical protein MKZ38_003830 [Zalerion maritima]|uniref:Uncharacterized protein n=1 Tax=Zalerion maritima TaxID=339359 RepID=A0AAD5RNJ3_9PEZI|nr:hypothetical protein MKZ38_003830 [Zalerion maritima]